MASSTDLPPRRGPVTIFRAFLNDSASGGIVLMAAAALALIVANSPLAGLYKDGLHFEAGGLSLEQWINDGLMALFFLLVGLEIKREILDGQLSTWGRRVLPGIAAVGGMIGPAIVYLAFNMGEGGHPRGWAIASATDIAFSLGVLALLGSRVPVGLRIFLTALAIIDDLGAILIIALFYTSELNLYALGGVAVVTAALVALNRIGVTRLAPYLLLGSVLWVLVLFSGVHATLAGVVLAMTIPLRPPREGDHSPLETVEHGLQPWVTFLVVPVFGFANAGISFAGLPPSALLQPVPIGIALGLLIGKQVGVFAAAGLVIRAGWADLPPHATWRQLYGVALLCGIGFTMSLFIGILAFPGQDVLLDEVKIGVLAGSIVSAALGALVLATSRSEARPL